MIVIAFDWFNMHKSYDQYSEMYEWLKENMEGYYRRHDQFCDAYEFDLDTDAMAFKLRWS